jgi:hypothetical protein
MKKKIIGILVITLLVTIVFSGCSEDKNSNNSNSINQDLSKFVGTWLEAGEAPNNLTWIFYENQSIKFIYYPAGNTGNSYIYWGAFELTGDILDVESDNIAPVSDRFNYEFQNLDTTLILTSIYGGDQTILNLV